MSEPVTDDDRERAVLEAMRAKIAESAAELRRLQGSADVASVPTAGRVTKWRPADDGAPSEAWRPAPVDPPRAEPRPSAGVPERAGPEGGAALGRQIDELAAQQRGWFEAIRSEIAAQAAQLEVHRGELLDQARSLGEHRGDTARLDLTLREVAVDLTGLGRRLDERDRELAGRLTRVLLWARLAAAAATIAILVALGAVGVAIS